MGDTERTARESDEGDFMKWPHFLTHTLSGAALTIVLCWIVGASPSVLVVVVAAVLGTLPDIPWTPWYIAWHEGGRLFWWTAWLPTIGLHTALIDHFYHLEVARSGDGWWKRYWFVEILLWVVSALILILAFI
jgi:hypothetical protein